MKPQKSVYRGCVGILVLTLLAGCVAIQPLPSTPLPAETPAPAADNANPPMPEIKPSGNVSVYVSGLDSPRGLKFGPDGSLYVAEGGQGGDQSTSDSDCEQVLPPVGPYSGAMTARISKIDADGQRTTVVDQLPSSQTGPDMGGLVSGVADIAFIEDTLYALITGAGCSHGLQETVNGVIRVENDGTWTQIADLSAFYQANPTKVMNPADFEPDGTPYSMIAVDGNLYVVEPNHGSLEKITPEGEITRLIDISAVAGHIVPTTLVYQDDFYVSCLSVFPVPAQSAPVLQIGKDGEVIHVTPGLTAVTGLAFDGEGRLYALQTTTVNGELPVPGTGSIVRIDLASGELEEIASGLALPTGMTFGPDGALYVSNYGFGFPAGMGEIVKVEVS